jgi:hypothetical protein
MYVDVPHLDCLLVAAPITVCPILAIALLMLLAPCPRSTPPAEVVPGVDPLIFG